MDPKHWFLIITALNKELLKIDQIVWISNILLVKFDFVIFVHKIKTGGDTRSQSSIIKFALI